MTCHLWHRLQYDIAQTYGVSQVDYALIARVQATSSAKVPTLLPHIAAVPSTLGSATSLLWRCDDDHQHMG